MYTWCHLCREVSSNDELESKKGRPINTPIQFDVLPGKKVVYVSCGQGFSIVIIENGEIYGWGDNGYGQLGVGHIHDREKPCRINSLEGIVIGSSRLEKATK